jgi:hypothetical protein
VDSVAKMPDLDPAWSGRLRAIFGAPLGEVEYEHIEALVPAQVSEAADLDFKEALYGNSAGDKHELCKDVAAMRNHRGGVIVLGVRDDNGAAVAVAGVAISDDEARRMRQIVAAGTAPHAEFEIRSVAGPTEGSGFYLLVADPSPYRPHAVVVNDGLRFPRRDGTTTRWLSEVEVADLYRDRFRGQADQLDRLARIGGEARDRVAPDGPWLVAAAVPNHAGSLSISFPGRRAIEEWARAEQTSTDFIDGFFEPPAAVMAGVGVERYTLTTHFDQGQRANHAYAECHTDGAAAAARILYTPTHSDDGVTVLDTSLVMTAAKCLRLIGRHAGRAGAYADAAVHLQLCGTDMHLGYVRDGFPQRHQTGLAISQAHSRHTIPLDSLATDPQGLFAATRVMLSDIFNAFGRAEVPHIAVDGALRLRYFNDTEFARWAQAHGLLTSAETVAD